MTPEMIGILGIVIMFVCLAARQYIGPGRGQPLPMKDFYFPSQHSGRTSS